MSKNKDTVRVTVDMNREFYERFAQLQELTHVASKAELIRNALQAYEYLAERQAEGWDITATSTSGKTERPVFLHLPRPKDASPLSATQESARR